MLSQKLSDCICNEPLDLKSQATPTHKASACSCSVCDSVSCFYIRHRKSTLPCSCNHQKVDVEYGKSITKEAKYLKEKDNFTEIIDYKKSDVDVLSDTKCDLTPRVQVTCENPTNENIALCSVNNDKENSKAELSAQIMNVPYEEFKCSLSNKFNRSDSAHNNDSPNPNCKMNELVKPDILTRLKEIYNACSCKVCECITDKSLLNTKPLLEKSLSEKKLCNCSPCECNECVLSQKTKKLEPRPHSGCPCVSCDRKDCRGVVKKPTGVSACDCDPCDCLNCTDASNKSCTCEPCQCAECTINNRRKPVLPTNTQKSMSQSTCRCKPCECANCTQIFTTMAANLIQDMSKKYSHKHSENNIYLNDLVEFSDDVIEYDQNESRNSYQRNNPDHDINTTFINDQLIQTGYNYFNTIAMMAMYSTNYSKVELNNTKDCKCLGCECLICTSRENEIRNKISCNDFHHRNVAVTSHSKSCDCVACQCEFCSQTQNKLANKLIRLKDNCSCSICDCIVCENIVRSSRKDYIEVASRWVQQEQDLSKQVTKDASCTNIYPLKKGKLLTPTTFENNAYQPSCLKSQLNFSNNNFGPSKESRTHLNIIESSIKILPVYEKSMNLKPSNLESEISQLSITNSEYPVKDILSSNYLKNNNLHFGSTIDKDFYVPTNLNKAATGRDNNKLLEKHITETNIFGINSINCNEVTCSIRSNPFNCLDEPKVINMVNNKEIPCQETSNLTFNQSIISIFKSISESALFDISRAKNITFLNKRNFKTLNINSRKDLNNKSQHISKDNLVVSEENNEIVKAEGNVDPIKDEIKILKHKYAYYRIYRRLMRRSPMNKRKRTKDCYTDHENSNKINITENVNVTIDGRNEKKIGLTIKNEKIVDDFFSSEMDMLNKIKTNVQNIENDVLTKPWPILQKNFCMNYSEIRQNKGVCTIPDLELDVKHAVKFISQNSDDNENNILLQKTQNIIYRYNDAITQTQAMTNQVDKETNCSLIGSTESLRINMKYLLDLVLSRVVPMSKLNVLSSMFDTMERVSNNIPKNTSIESCCDGLKVNIIELRRVSNHSLLVRWKVPQKTACVQGYELQVDGRSVQKIFSPTQCMAVLTCLPRCERLLLTVRTLTAALPADHYPATTIVYRPRIQ